MLLGGGRGRSRIGTVVALVAVLAVVLASPAGAAGWREERGWAGAAYQHVLMWLGIAPSPDPGVVLKCDAGSQIDPNGACLPKARRQGGSRTDPNGHS